MTTIRIKDDFTRTPGHRSPDDGPFSGEQFLDEVLRPRFVAAQSHGDKLVVDLDGTAGYATSFLEAAFGGLAREFGEDAVLKTLDLRCSAEPYLPDEIREYIKDSRAVANC